MTEPILTLPAAALSDSSVVPMDLLSRHLALRFTGALLPDQCALAVRRVYAARSEWVAGFGGVQFMLGRAWYVDLEEDREDLYFRRAAESDQLVERWLPDMQSSLREMVRRLVGATAIRRPGWCGPGVHIFPAGEWLSRNGGEIHFDVEGLSEEHRAALAPALTLVLMLQPPETGGGLTVWDLRYDGTNLDSELKTPDVRGVTVPYEVGDLVVIDSYRLHRIEPFGGLRDRISITAHAAKAGALWEVWF